MIQQEFTPIKFEEVLDSACERLKRIEAKNTVKKIVQLEEELDLLEQELDKFIQSNKGYHDGYEENNN